MTAVRWYVWTFSAVLIGIIIIANLGLAPAVFPFMRTIPYGDKIGHFFLMGGLSFLLNISLSDQRMSILSMAVQRGTVIALFVVTLEECSQLFFAHRTFDLVDLFWSVAGILVFGILASVVIVRHRTHTA